ncbi:5029_t:CDS:2, partial [Scutellospora calospora]
MSSLLPEIIEQITHFYSESLFFNDHYKSIDSKQYPKRLIDKMHFTLSKEYNCSSSDSKSWLILKQSKDKKFSYYKCERCQFYEIAINYSKRKSKIKSVKRKR